MLDSEQAKLYVIAIGLILSILQFVLPLVSWAAAGEPSYAYVNILDGLFRMIVKKNHLWVIVVLLVGLTPLLYAFFVAKAQRLSREAVIFISVSFLGFQMLGLWAFTVELLIYNYGKVYWTMASGSMLHFFVQFAVALTFIVILFESLVSVIQRKPRQ